MKNADGFVCEYNCGHQLPYGSNIGQECRAVARERMIRHEQRCEKNPLVIVIKDIRVMLQVLEKHQVSIPTAKLAPAICKTFECFGPEIKIKARVGPSFQKAADAVVRLRETAETTPGSKVAPKKHGLRNQN